MWSGDFVCARERTRKRARAPLEHEGSCEQGRAEKSFDENFSSAWPSLYWAPERKLQVGKHLLASLGGSRIVRFRVKNKFDWKKENSFGIRSITINTLVNIGIWVLSPRHLTEIALYATVFSGSNLTTEDFQMSTLTRLWIRARRKKDQKMLEIIRAIKHERFEYPAAAAFWIKYALDDYGSIAKAIAALRKLQPETHSIVVCSEDSSRRNRIQVHGTGYLWIYDEDCGQQAVMDSFGRLLSDSRIPTDPRW